MKKRPSIRQIKNFPKYFLGLILAFIILNVIICFSSVGKFAQIKVKPLMFKVHTYRNIDLGENSFTTGLDGTLIWKVKNIKEALLTDVADWDGVLSTVDLLYFLVLDIFLFWLVSGIKEDNVFSRLKDNLGILNLLIWLYPTLLIINYLASAECIKYLTNNQFTVQYRYFSILKYVVISYLIKLAFPFIKKGESLQQEQDLTI